MSIRCFVLTAVLTLALAPARGIPFTDKDLASEESLEALYERWRRYYMAAPGAAGAASADRARRFNAFKGNVRYIQKANKKGRPFRLELNKFADMTSDEFRRTYAGSRVLSHRSLGGDRRQSKAGRFMYADARNLPLAVDWRQQGAVTGIKDQAR